jgi:hypothetical protein
MVKTRGSSKKKCFRTYNRSNTRLLGWFNCICLCFSDTGLDYWPCLSCSLLCFVRLCCSISTRVCYQRKKEIGATSS